MGHHVPCLVVPSRNISALCAVNSAVLFPYTRILIITKKKTTLKGRRKRKKIKVRRERDNKRRLCVRKKTVDCR